jgi:hypothetical protein
LRYFLLTLIVLFTFTFLVLISASRIEAKEPVWSAQTTARGGASLTYNVNDDSNQALVTVYCERGKLVSAVMPYPDQNSHKNGSVKIAVNNSARSIMLTGSILHRIGRDKPEVELSPDSIKPLIDLLAEKKPITVSAGTDKYDLSSFGADEALKTFREC